MLDQMFSYEEEERVLLQEQQTAAEWKRNLKRNATKVDQFAEDLERFKMARN